MITTSALTQKGQVTIPAYVRKILNLKPLDRLVFSVEFGKVVASPVKANIMDLYGSINVKSKKSVDLKKVRKIVMKKYAKKIALEGI